jgi:hypothetical protein
LQLFDSARRLIEVAVYENSSNLGPLFPNEFHKDLKTLILQIVTAHLPEWRETAINTSCSLPRLQDFDWRIDVKRASDTMSNMSVPTVLVQLEVSKMLIPCGPFCLGR